MVVHPSVLIVLVVVPLRSQLHEQRHCAGGWVHLSSSLHGLDPGGGGDGPQKATGAGLQKRRLPFAHGNDASGKLYRFGQNQKFKEIMINNLKNE